VRQIAGHGWDWAKQITGHSYSYLSALNGGVLQHVPGKSTEPGSKMCSELVWDIYFNVTGRRLTSGNMPNPGEVCRSTSLSVVGRLV
jgi:hypothetical protein